MAALVLELVDKRDLKSLGQKCPYGFDPRPGHRKSRSIHIYAAALEYIIRSRSVRMRHRV